MKFVNFLIDNPVMAWLAFLALLVTLVPAASWLFRRIFPHEEKTDKPAKTVESEDNSVRFLGTQLDIAILILGLLIIMTLIGWICQIFF
jgi:Na+-transporting methylmalonyl-CoA/oxaloacetate decarboxylase gamma subunit